MQGGGGVRFSVKKCYEYTRFNVISITREWVGVKFLKKALRNTWMVPTTGQRHLAVTSGLPASPWLAVAVAAAGRAGFNTGSSDGCELVRNGTRECHGKTGMLPPSVELDASVEQFLR